MNRQPLYTCARLTTGQIVPLRKDCDCVTHTGPHWLYSDQSWREANRAEIGGSPSMLAPRGLAIEEIARLRELARAFAANGIAQLLTPEDVDAIRAGGEAVDVSRPGLRPAIKRLIGMSYNDARTYGPGYLTWAGFVAVWTWAAVRLGGEAGQKHDLFYAKHGAAAYYARINKVRRACGFAPVKA